MTLSNLNRRTALRTLGGAAVGAMTFGTFKVARGGQTVTVGFLAVDNWNDYGYTQSHLESAENLARLTGATVLKEEGVPEGVEVQKAMKSMIELSGASVIVATAWGYYDPHVLEVAREYPDVQFLHCGGIWEPGQPENVATYFAYSDEVAYIAGYVAARLADSDQLGFLGSKPIPEILRFANSFTLGARVANPSVTTKLVLTGDWTNPVREAEATNSLIDQGIKAIGCDIDIPKIFIETCAKRQTFCTGMHVSQYDLAPDWFLTGAEWNWAAPVQKCIDAVQAGTPVEHNMRGSLADDMVRMSKFGNAVPEDVRRDAEGIAEELKSQTRAIYSGELRDNKGNVVIPAGTSIAINDPSLETTEWLVDGIIGSTT